MPGRPLSISHQTGLNHPHSSLSSTSGSGPTPRRNYRPFSAQSPYTDIATAESLPSLRRSASVGGLHQFCNNMGLQFGSKGRKELVRPNSPAVLPSPNSLRPTNKRSMALIFGASSNAYTTPSSPSSDELPVINISKKRVSSEELDACDNFVPKNVWAKRCKMKLHPYHKQVAYMRAYDPISLESDRYTELLFQRLTNGSPSFHHYCKKSPAMALDLGCGQGHWILHAANVWSNTEFVGVDIVDITLPAFETVENVRLVRGDFLNYKLPFPDNTFDFVRMANLALCIPYDKWEFVLSQVRRVLMPGGRLELIDDDIYFPYGDGWKEVETLVPASPLSGSFFGDERLEPGMNVGDNGMKQGEDTDDGDSIPIMAEATDSSLLSDTLHSPGSTPRYERTVLKPTISSRSPTPGDRRQRSELKMISRSTTPRIDVLPSPTTRKEGNPSPPCPKRTREKVALLPSIRSITPAFPLSSGSKYYPTWSLRTADTSPTRSDASSIRTTDTSPTTSIGSVVNQVDPKNSEWQRKVSTSKNMESLFEKMLVEQYGIHPRPSEFMLRVLGKVFQEDGNDGAGNTRVGMKKSFHIKLAPIETIGDKIDSDRMGGKEKGRGGMEEADVMASTSTGTSPTADANSKPQNQNGISLRPRPWQQKNRSKKGEDKKNKTKQEEELGRQSELKNTQAGVVNTTAPMAVSPFKRSRYRDPVMSNLVRPDLSAKAAGILGIPYSELSAVTLSLSISSSKERRSPAMPLSWSCSSNLSVKAAGRLGIPYSEALSATAALSISPNPAHLTTSTLPPITGSEAASSPSNTTSEFVQHPGLLIWPDTYVPMSPGELEMHACKYIHTLLGCRPALEEFVAKFVDERGDRLVGEEELSDEIWEYECFRRGRFNWPSEAAEPYEDDPTNPNAAGPSFLAPCAMPTSSGVGTGGTVDTNSTAASTLDLPAIITTGSVSGNRPLLSKTTRPQLRATNDFGGFLNEKSSLLSRSSSPNRQRAPLSSSMPMKARSKIMHSLSNSRPASPMPSSPRLPSPDDELYEWMTEGHRDYRNLDDLVHLRWIRVFEGIKAP